ncbi:contractile injection system protein, VgrG/Pvc8 family [Sphingomonas sp. NFR15]|uniref:contractile injection system protein, VgrG/Pvc8 family n=1 Tax=Sphingomonas sp. NFR15 TaxID=1566282 RepID=UPI0008899C22|nr:contractile injection system protein, VgrG/Pvc8 family [Sphingomonas sp. NFR15]SDA21680.1 hypothetical protein SAMN03159340_01479 [Sphingomonas sp. NFR15]
MISNVPDYRVTLDGKDLTARFRPRLLSLSITEKRGDEADQLDIALDDADGRLALPKAGAVLHIQIGWKQGSGVKVGLVDKGSFVVDEIEHSGPPDAVTIRARSADFTSDLRTRRETSWHDTTVGAVVSEVAGRNGLSARCAPALASVSVKTLAQSRESDMALLRRLGREHDAVATIKRGALIFAPVGSGQTASGAALPSLSLRRRDGDRHSYRVEKREEAEGVTASYHDRDEAARKDVTVGKAAGAKKLSHVYATKSSAERAAKSTMKRAGRQPVSLTLALALGRADLYPEQKASVCGFKAEIDAIGWLVSEVTHTVNDRGFVTGLKLESAS